MPDVTPYTHRERDAHHRPLAHDVEHDLDPADLADALTELVDDGYLHDDTTLDDDWWDEPADSKFRNYHDQPARYPHVEWR